MKNIVYLVVLKPVSHRTAEESLGIQYLASALIDNGFDVEIRDAWLDDNITTETILNEIINDKKNIAFVGTSSYMLNNAPTCEFIKKLSNFGINIVSGGYGPSFEPEMFLDAGSKIVMIGEGEKSIIDVANYFSSGNIKLENISGVQYRLNDKSIVSSNFNVTKNLDELSYPTRPYIDNIKKRKSTVNVLTSRGCNGVCTFCSICAYLKKQKSPKWRGRTIQNIIPELIELKKKGVQTVKFVDDSFIENERDGKWCEEFADACSFNKLNMAFRASIRADKVTNDVIYNLKRAGFFSFSCGIENGSVTALKRMAKLASLEDNEKALKIFKDNDIYVQAGFILFDNKTTIKELEENYEFLRKHIDLVSKGIFSEMYAAVGTQFTKNVIDESFDKFASNNLYLVEDKSARIVYDYMKKWQQHHSHTYDMVIDPISAPKDIPVSEMKKYHELMVIMKSIDLDFMRDILECVKNNENPETLYNFYIKKYDNIFANIEKQANIYYDNDGLNYDASENSFLTIENVNKNKNEFDNFLFNDNLLNNIYSIVQKKAKEENDEDFFNAHFVPCAKICFELAKIKNLDLHISIIIGLLHDYGKFFIDKNNSHEKVGAVKAEIMLKKLGLSPDNINIITTAINDHKKDANVEDLSQYSKLIIDADIISYLENIDYFYNYLKENGQEPEQACQIVNNKIKSSKARLDDDGKLLLDQHKKYIKIVDDLNYCK